MHCAAGRSRSATVVAAHLMQKERISAEDAIEEIRQKWWICPNIGFRQQLELFHKLGADISRWPEPKSSTWPKKVRTLVCWPHVALLLDVAASLLSTPCFSFTGHL